MFTRYSARSSENRVMLASINGFRSTPAKRKSKTSSSALEFSKVCKNKFSNHSLKPCCHTCHFNMHLLHGVTFSKSLSWIAQTNIITSKTQLVNTSCSKSLIRDRKHIMYMYKCNFVSNIVKRMVANLMEHG